MGRGTICLLSPPFPIPSLPFSQFLPSRQVENKHERYNARCGGQDSRTSLPSLINSSGFTNVLIIFPLVMLTQEIVRHRHCLRQSVEQTSAMNQDKLYGTDRQNSLDCPAALPSHQVVCVCVSAKGGTVSAFRSTTVAISLLGHCPLSLTKGTPPQRGIFESRGQSSRAGEVEVIGRAAWRRGGGNMTETARHCSCQLPAPPL